MINLLILFWLQLLLMAIVALKFGLFYFGASLIAVYFLPILLLFCFYFAVIISECMTYYYNVHCIYFYIYYYYIIPYWMYLLLLLVAMLAHCLFERQRESQYIFCLALGCVSLYWEFLLSVNPVMRCWGSDWSVSCYWLLAVGRCVVTGMRGWSARITK